MVPVVGVELLVSTAAVFWVPFNTGTLPLLNLTLPLPPAGNTGWRGADVGVEGEGVADEKVGASIRHELHKHGTKI